jgi:hypothetical protein
MRGEAYFDELLFLRLKCFKSVDIVSVLRFGSHGSPVDSDQVDQQDETES